MRVEPAIQAHRVEHQMLAFAADWLRGYHTQHPEATVPQLLDELDRHCADLAAHTEEDMCGRCGRRIGPAGDGWAHLSTVSGAPVSSCRAASFTPGEGWDDRIPDHWNATPA